MDVVNVEQARVAEASNGFGEAMVGRVMCDLAEGERLAARGWQPAVAR